MGNNKQLQGCEMNLYELDVAIEHYLKTGDINIVKFYLKKRKELVKKIRINVFNKLNKIGV